MIIQIIISKYIHANVLSSSEIFFLDILHVFGTITHPLPLSPPNSPHALPRFSFWISKLIQVSTTYLFAIQSLHHIFFVFILFFIIIVDVEPLNIVFWLLMMLKRLSLQLISNQSFDVFPFVIIGPLFFPKVFMPWAHFLIVNFLNIMSLILTLEGIL